MNTVKRIAGQDVQQRIISVANAMQGIMKIVIEIEYKPCDENETFERIKEIVTGNIENCLGKVLSVKEVKE